MFYLEILQAPGSIGPSRWENPRHSPDGNINGIFRVSFCSFHFSATRSRGVGWSVHRHPQDPNFSPFFLKKKQPPQPSERLCCLTCNLGISSLSFPSCCSLPNNQQLNPAFLPHFYCFLGYKRFHLLMHVPVSPLPRRGLVPWCSEHRDGDRGTSLVCRPRCHQASPCPRWIFGLRVGFFCARVVCARLRIPLLPFNWCC